MQNSFKVTLHQEWVVGGWIVLLENQEMARSRIGGAFGGPGGALALGGPWFGALALVVPWWPCRRVALDSVPGSPGPPAPTLPPRSLWP